MKPDRFVLLYPLAPERGLWRADLMLWSAASRMFFLGYPATEASGPDARAILLERVRELHPGVAILELVPA